MPNPLQRIPPFTIRRDVLSAEELAALLDWTLANEAALKPSQVGKSWVRPDRRNAMSLYGAAPWKDWMSERMAALMPGILEELGMPWFAMDKFEIEMVTYPDGGFIVKHHDTATGLSRHKHDRVVSLVYYFHEEPKGYSGGELRLTPKLAPPEGAPTHADIAPEQNSVLAFPSWAIHEVLPVSVPSREFRHSRFAINFWAQRRYAD